MTVQDFANTFRMFPDCGHEPTGHLILSVLSIAHVAQIRLRRDGHQWWPKGHNWDITELSRQHLLSPEQSRILSLLPHDKWISGELFPETRD